MQRLVIALVIFAALIWGSFWSSNTVKTTVSDMIQHIESDQIDAAYKKWNSAQSLLGSLLLHDELDSISRLFERVYTAQKIDAQDDYLLDRAELITQLQHLPQLENPSLKNLL